MNILVLQHLDVEHPGVLRDFMREDGFSWTTVRLDHGEPIPAVDGFDLMLVMGGPQDVWQEDLFPWLATEKAAIRKFVMDLERPYLGLCLGHQLLAEAVGGKVGPGSAPEVGLLSVIKTEAGRSDPLLASLADPATVVQWHGAEVKTLPEAAVVLASSNACRVQAFRYGDHAYGLQFHVEVTEATVGEWAAIPEYADALARVRGAEFAGQLDTDVRRALPGLSRDARGVYEAMKRFVRAGS